MKALLKLFFLFLMGQAAATTITLNFDGVGQLQLPGGKTTPAISAGAVFNIDAVVDGGGQNVGDIEIQGLNNFNIVGNNREMSITVVNGTMVSKTVHHVTVQARKEGTFVVGPAKLNSGSEQSNVLQIQVTKPSEKIGQQESAQNQSSSNQVKVICKLIPEKTDVVVGQSFLLTLRIQVQGPIMEMALNAPPSFTGFLSKELKQQSNRREVIDGQTWGIIEKKYILTSLNAGAKEINAINLTYAVPVQRTRKMRGFFDDFFDAFHQPVEQKTITSDPIKIHVAALPRHQGPVDAVGNYTSFSAEVDKINATTNEPIKLTLTVDGKGNLDQITTPKLTLPPGFKSYDSKSEVTEDSTPDVMGGSKRFEYVVQAIRAGQIQIPAQQFTYYDTETKSFKTLKTDPIDLVIKQGSGPSAPPPPQPSKEQQEAAEKPITPPSQEKEESTTEDIFYIHEDSPAQQPPSAGLPWWVFLLLLISPCLLFTTPLLAHVNRLKSKSSLFDKRLSSFDKELDDIVHKHKAAALYQFFIQVLATKYKVPTTQVTEDWIEGKLKSTLERDKVTEFMDYLSSCASVHFSSSTSSSLDQQSLLKKAKYWLLILSK